MKRSPLEVSMRLSLPYQKKLSFIKSQPLKWVVTALFVVTIAGAQSTEKVIATIASQYPNGGMALDQKGNLYGTAAGSQLQFGIVFELRPYPSGIWQNKVLYRFGGGTDGAYPQSSPVLDAQGNLYGATTEGGIVNSCGTVFQLMPTPTGRWTKKVLYNFVGNGCRPSGGLIWDSAGNLYGTTTLGGTGYGTVFELLPGSNGTWTERVLHEFNGTSDGNGPSGGLVIDGAGNLYGTTIVGGAKGAGTIFELSPGSGDTWTFHLLYTLCSRTACADGANTFCSGTSCYEGFPARLVLDDQGSLYGTATYGGIPSCSGGRGGCGTAFKLSKSLTGTWTFHLLHSFCSLSLCPDGAFPSGGLILDSVGNLYGPTAGGSSKNSGTVFKLSSHVSGSPWVLDTLYSFCALAQCADGVGPQGSLVLNGAGNLFGTTANRLAFEVIP
jgi:uncharacterized repeat protein (TIGR03803 family)